MKRLLAGLLLAAGCSSGAAYAKPAPTETIKLTYPPAFVTFEKVAGVRVICGVWAVQDGSLVLRCFKHKATPRPAKKTNPLAS